MKDLKLLSKELRIIRNNQPKVSYEEAVEQAKRVRLAYINGLKNRGLWQNQ